MYVFLFLFQLRRWYRKLCYFYKIFKNKFPAYLFNLIPAKKTHYSHKNSDNIPFSNTRHCFFKNSFFPSTIIEWFKLDISVRKYDIFNVFKKEILKFIRRFSNSFHNSRDPIAIKYYIGIRLGLSLLREQKFKHSFKEPFNPVCICGNDFESVSRNERCTLLNSLSKIEP